ncbi:AAA family ATPase [Anaerocolumna sp. AGMB13025]|uniref:AAA family ATPase n=1 Tax=Anaerocolumna sp. AGMB13025 TaxID=3039116 RepID=UPI00241ECCF0|nr:AAA family ATPase [Anaerocolumna sp. AGMB13025]WFR58369.1 AAA family ATPase [Anaerocolumna sp. AGMB13025]
MDVKTSITTLKRYSLARIPFISFHTMEKARGIEVLKTVSYELNLPFYVHTLSKGIYDISTGKIVNDDKTIIGALDFMAEQIRLKQNLTFVLTEVSDIENDSMTSRYLLDIVSLAEENGGVIITITNGSVWGQLQRLGMTVTLDLPTEEEMLQIIYENTEPYKRDITIEWDNNDYREAATILTGVTRVEAQNVIASLIANRIIKKTDLTELKFVKDKLFSNIEGLERIEIADKILEIGGLSGLKSWLDEKKRLQTPEKRDELRKRGLQPPRGVLLVGVPGCGKSLSAKAVAASWNLPLYRLDFATVQGQYVGQSEQQLKEAFQSAEHLSPCILWIDEIEKGLGGTGNDSSGVTTRMVGQFLFWIQECKKMVFVVATANDVSMLPSELLRRGRFDELFFIDLPTEEERKEIIEMYIKRYLQVQLSENTIQQMVSTTDGFTGADLEASIREISYRLIANENITLTEDMIIDSLKNVIPLSQTSPEKIESIREWGRERAVPASGKPIGGKELENKHTRRVIV